MNKLGVISSIKAALLLILFSALIFIPSKVFASEYVLPYPGVMPGSRLYVLKEIKNYIDGFWYFGNISQFKYSLSLSDEYLVESKILFEYNQFSLALESLKKSSKYYVDASRYIDKAGRDGKDIDNINNLYNSAGEKHIEVLVALKIKLPEYFFWDPEDKEGSDLMLYEEIDKAISIR